MSGKIIPFTVVLDNGDLPPAFDFEIALQAAREAEASGRIAVRIRCGKDTVLEGDELRRRLYG